MQVMHMMRKLLIKILKKIYCTFQMMKKKKNGNKRKRLNKKKGKIPKYQIRLIRKRKRLKTQRKVK